MPRPLPALADDFEREIAQAIDLTSRIEAAQLALHGLGALRGEIGLTGLEQSYELAYLRTFLAWEVFLESTFYRLLCGYTSLGVQEIRVGGAAYTRTFADAEAAVLGGRGYVLWHNPDHVIARADRFFQPGQYRLVIASATTRVGYFAAIRHRIAHSQDHAKRTFDQVTASLAGRRYRASRPGRFLRDWAPGAHPPERWLHVISDEMLGLARQICP